MFDVFGTLQGDGEFAVSLFEKRKIASDDTLIMSVLSRTVSTHECQYGFLFPSDDDPPDIKKVGILVSGVPAFVPVSGSEADRDDFVSTPMDLLIVFRPYKRGFRMATFYSSQDGRAEFQSELKPLPRVVSSGAPRFFFREDDDLFVAYESSQKPLTPEQLNEMEFAATTREQERERQIIENTHFIGITGKETIEFWNNKARQFLSVFHGNLTDFNAHTLLNCLVTAPFAYPGMACMHNLSRKALLQRPLLVAEMHPVIRQSQGKDYYPPLVVAGIVNHNPAVFRLMLDGLSPNLIGVNIVVEEDAKTGISHFNSDWPTASRNGSISYHVLSWLTAAIRAKTIWEPKYPGEKNPVEDILKMSVEYGGPDVVNVQRTAKVGDVDVEVMPPLFFAALNSTPDLQYLLGLPYIDTSIMFLDQSPIVMVIRKMQQSPQEQEFVDSLHVLLNCDKVKLTVNDLGTIFAEPSTLPIVLRHGRRPELVGLLQQLSTEQLKRPRNIIAKNQLTLGLQDSLSLLQMFQTEVLPTVKEKEIASLGKAETDLILWQKECNRVRAKTGKSMSVGLLTQAVSLAGQEPSLRQQAAQWNGLVASHGPFDQFLQRCIDLVRTDLQNARFKAPARRMGTTLSLD
ncbi:MAG: hypothetical protein LBL30_00655 [Holosporales bacterium]|nr:hypothetical protein [Holosporales bacterium]